LRYHGNVIRPPSEAESILLQVTYACSHNRCAFCGAYAGERFGVRGEPEVFEDIDHAAAHLDFIRRVFLLSGDAMILPFKRLRRILERIRERLPRVTRVGTYANVKALAQKTPEELRELAGLGLTMVYMGLESGDDLLLRAMGKEADVADMQHEAAKIRAAGMKLSATVIVGLAGREGSGRHARLTGEALTAMAPDQAAALTLMAVPGTPLYDEIRAGRFTPLDPLEMVAELRAMLHHLHAPRGLFLADHASNHVPLKLRLPRDRARGLELLDAALAGAAPLRPEWARRL
jgi:radical SAM superfamily enzyme YgiQ (UPF0313 family)